jgi:phospholipid transport system transporter-binding protein
MLTLLENGYLEISGPLNFINVTELWDQAMLLLAKPAEINIDLGKVSSSNSAGLALLLELVKYANKKNKPIRFHRVPEQLVSIATAAGVMDFLM